MTVTKGGSDRHERARRADRQSHRHLARHRALRHDERQRPGHVRHRPGQSRHRRRSRSARTTMGVQRRAHRPRSPSRQAPRRHDASRWRSVDACAATRPDLRDERGFTLIELVVAMPIMLIVMGGLLLMLTHDHRTGAARRRRTTHPPDGVALRDEQDGDRAFAAPSTATESRPDQPRRPRRRSRSTRPTSTRRRSPAASESSFHLLKISYQVTRRDAPAPVQDEHEHVSRRRLPHVRRHGSGRGRAADERVVDGRRSGRSSSGNSITNAVPDVFCYYHNTDGCTIRTRRRRRAVYTVADLTSTPRDRRYDRSRSASSWSCPPAAASRTTFTRHRHHDRSDGRTTEHESSASGRSTTTSAGSRSSSRSR